MILKKNIEPGGNEGHDGLCPTELLTSSAEAAMELFYHPTSVFQPLGIALYLWQSLFIFILYLHHILSSSV